MDATKIYVRLISQKPSVTSELPRDQRGIYMLWDHEGIPRYIGIVDKDSFHKRIDGRHRGGSEENSHKFSAAYNTGRMWRDRKRIGETIGGIMQTADGAATAKRLRMAFIRRHCRATFVPVSASPGQDYGSHVRGMEAAVQRLARPDHRSWETQARIQLAEPGALVDELVSDMIAAGQLSLHEVSLLADQKAIHANLYG